MSAYEQRVEPPDRQWQYLLFAAEPYETIGFKVSGEGEKGRRKGGKVLTSVFVLVIKGCISTQSYWYTVVWKIFGLNYFGVKLFW